MASAVSLGLSPSGLLSFRERERRDEKVRGDSEIHLIGVGVQKIPQGYSIPRHTD
jgi:hypothetical protein